MLCFTCIQWQSAVDGIRSPYIFDGVIRQAIHQLKYNNLRAMAALLARMMYDYLVGSAIPADVLVPVPLHPKRLRERGYNQSGLIARTLGKLASMDVIEDSLIRLEYRLPQARTSNVDERQRNVAGAFACRGDALAGKRVLLIDDVSTSGATLDACAAAVKAAGAKSAWGLVAAREI